MSFNRVPCSFLLAMLFSKTLGVKNAEVIAFQVDMPLSPAYRSVRKLHSIKKEMKTPQVAHS